MRKILLIAMCAALSGAWGEISARTPESPVKHIKKSRKASAGVDVKQLAGRAAEAGALWCATTEKTYGWDGSRWVQDETYKVQYDAKGNVSMQNIIDADGFVSRETMTWNENGMLATRMSQVAESEGADFENSGRLSRTYDERVTSFITFNDQDIWFEGACPPPTSNRHNITRDAAGNITLMERAVYFGGIYDPTFRLTMTYGTDGKATRIEESNLKYDYSTQNYYWEPGMIFSNIVWENTDGQIVSDEDLFTGANRIKSATMTDGDTEMNVTAEYASDGGYTAHVTYYDAEEEEDVASVVTYTPLDGNGSVRIVTTTDYSVGGDVYYTESYTEVYRYDAFGLILLEEEQFSDGTYAELLDRIQGTVEYDATHGYPTRWTLQQYDYDTEEMNNIFRAEYSDYVDASAGITDIEADTDAPVEYYNLQGVRVSRPEAGSVYIRRQGTTAVKVMVK